MKTRITLAVTAWLLPLISIWIALDPDTFWQRIAVAALIEIPVAACLGIAIAIIAILTLD
ncbi:MAG: hypothetical protein JRD89_02175 [Deltaproteobacteria bacterium]|nr:hypothetical protein [Deltaproteobacteria bacterium]